MAYFDTKKQSMVIVYAFPVGISAILAQREPNSQQYKIISYASRSLTPVERTYSQTDREAPALVWWIEHYRLFLIGSQFDLITDHKALEAIFNNPRSNPPARIERWMLQLQPYNFTVIYRTGSLNESDYMSRHPASKGDTSMTENIADAYVNFIVNHSVLKSMTLDEIKDATTKDPVMTKLRESIYTRHWDKQDQKLKTYIQSADQFTVIRSGDIILKGNRIVILELLQGKVTKLGHFGHQGKEKTKKLLREKVWYPRMDQKVKDMIDKCIALHVRP